VDISPTKICYIAPSSKKMESSHSRIGYQLAFNRAFFPQSKDNWSIFLLQLDAKSGTLKWPTQTWS